MKKYILGILGGLFVWVLVFGFLSQSKAVVTSFWNLSGNYEWSFFLDPDTSVTPYTHHVTLNHTGLSVNGNGGYPVTGGDTFHWNITSGTLTDNDFSLTAIYDVGANGTIMHIFGTIASDGTMSGTWDDNYAGSTRTGTWNSGLTHANLFELTSKDECKKDLWKSFGIFKNQGDCVSFVATKGKNQPLVASPTPIASPTASPSPTPQVSSFTASQTFYYNGLTVDTGLYGNGPITFNWDPNTGNVSSGFWDEVVPATTGPHYNNVIIGGTVAGTNVNLSFHREADNYNFSFTGSLVGNDLSGQMAGPYLFTATGN